MNRVNQYLPYTAGLIVGLYFIGLNVFGDKLEFLPGDYIDGRFNNYLLEHALQFFTGKVSNFWNAPFMFPEKNVITYSDNLLGTAPVYSVFRLFGFDRETSFQLWYIALMILNYTGCYLLLHFLFKNKYAAASGAMVFAFSLALNSQLGHAQTCPRFAAPLAVWMLLKFNEGLNPKLFFWAIFFLVYQMYCGIYLGFLLAIPFTTIFIFIISQQRNLIRSKIKEVNWLKQMIVGGLLNLLIILPLLIPYFQRAWITGFRPFETLVNSIPTVSSYLFSWKGSLCWDSLSQFCVNYPSFWDHEIFAGGLATVSFVLVALICIASFFSKKIFSIFQVHKTLQIVFFSGIITFIVFLRIGDLSIYRIVYAVPGYGSMRALQRIINVELLFFAIAFAYFVNLVTKKNNWYSLVLAIFIVAVFVCDNYVPSENTYRCSKTDSQIRIQALVKKMNSVSKRSVVSYEPDSLFLEPMLYHLDAMLAAQTLGLATLNGYSATSPQGYGAYWEKPCETSRKLWLAKNTAVNLKVEVVH